MLALSDQVAILRKAGYRQDAAEAKVAHDAILLAMSKAGFKRASTVKGGVVMSHISQDIRRATMDMDIAFVRRSISELSIRRFVAKLNRISGIRISLFGTIAELAHEDYRGKRIYLDVSDGSLREPLRTKLDIGVHAHAEIVQVEYSFGSADGMDHADLQANSNEQIFAEKLLSLVRFRMLSRRPKDIFDLYYLRDLVRLEVLRQYVEILIYKNRKCQVRDKPGLIDVLTGTFASKTFMRRLASARANWLDVPPDEATSAILSFVSSL